MRTLNPEDLAARYELLCRSTQAGVAGNACESLLVPHQSTLDTLIRNELRALGRQGSPDDFADICFELEQELERFNEFCAFPMLAEKFVVAFGGGFSAGKSSLINAVLGKRLLVTEVDPTTSLPTYLVRGEVDATYALNLFGHRIALDDTEFLSLTHDEVARYGSNVSRLLRSAILTRSEFPWSNLALIDTPGYTKHDEQGHSERTDEHIARTQLNSAQAIVWVIDARQGCITEDDINFLGSLRPEIPRLIAVSRADQKPAEDIAQIVAGIRATLATRNLPCVDVVAVSARKKEWAPDSVREQLSLWNSAGRELRFAHNFKRQFSRYSQHLENERRQAQLRINRLNRILALSDEETVQQDAQELKSGAENVLQSTERLQSDLASLRHRFFSELKAIGDHVGIPLPEPSELDLLDAPGFDLLQALRKDREAEGKGAPDEPASLRELAQPGDMSRLTEFLDMWSYNFIKGNHSANGFYTPVPETYARLLTAVTIQGQIVLTEMQSDLFMKVLESLDLPDIRASLLVQVRKIGMDDVQECLRVISDKKLEKNFFFDTLMLSRSSGTINADRVGLLAELAEALGLAESVVAEMANLTGYAFGIHNNPKYASFYIQDLEPWCDLVFMDHEEENFRLTIESLDEQMRVIERLRKPSSI